MSLAPRLVKKRERQRTRGITHQRSHHAAFCAQRHASGTPHLDEHQRFDTLHQVADVGFVGAVYITTRIRGDEFQHVGDADFGQRLSPLVTDTFDGGNVKFREILES